MPLSHDRRILLLALVAGLPALIATGILLWTVPATDLLRGTLLGALILVWLGAARAAQVRVVRPLQVIANIVAGLREGHFTIRAREETVNDVLGEVRHELNALSETLKEQRLGALEADALLKRLMEEVDVAVFAFDGGRLLRVANRAGERLLGQPIERVLGSDRRVPGPRALSPRRYLPGSWRSPCPRAAAAAGRSGGAASARAACRSISSCSPTSRGSSATEERQVWQRLVRVLSHEINNSLAPIKSLAATLTGMLDREPRPPDLEEDLRSGLGVVAARADALNRFMASYARLAKLPPPTLGPVEVGDWVWRVAQLDPRLAVKVVPGPPTTIRADGDQLDQVLINLVKNAIDAVQGTEGGVEVTWREVGDGVEVVVRDEGAGLSSSSNLFVPFFTTKPSGSGIGLVFSRQVVEAHGGKISLANRTDRSGVEARVWLPSEPPERDGRA